MLRLALVPELATEQSTLIGNGYNVLKVGTKAVIKRILEGKDHQLDCKVDGAGEMMVTAKYVKRA